MRQDLINIIKEDCDRVTANFVDDLSVLRGECILITGGTGFVGTWLTELIVFLNDAYGFNTKLVLLSSRAYNFSAKAPHLALRKDILLVEQDVRAFLDISSDVNWIIHAAANPDSRLHASDPLKIIDVIIKGTESALMAATRLPNLKKFLNISSGLVYGLQPLEMEVTPENFRGVLDFTSINSAYAEAKQMGETLCAVYRNQHRLPVVNARPFAFIGPYQLLDRPWAINNFIRDSLLGSEIRILGDGETIRSYMYPSDMALWLLVALVKGRIGASYNIGSSHGITLKSLASIICSNFANPPEITVGSSEITKLKRSKLVPDTSLASKELKLDLTVNIKESIRKTILWNLALMRN
ncbi:NAD-dependent epimerase/dehydratase family protein [Limnothrix sp. FACHB-708]|uniref:NAD-dependent epimerase/dehydratase family protein n=1 Tax=unclassified Limnothrix TaxID=2632864 RepID=UPI0016861A47|nr:NAD-dependent epimerase/dehydratase family protein [Limnothrix sp. FACHB-708]MBD2592100.1 NAD-dependent epimerase/dehydratase family protein [Limnothrix sp. FACHB-406]